MKKKNARIMTAIMALVLCISMTACASQPEVTAEESIALTVSAAASLTDALTEIQTLYTAANPNVTITFNFGGSGALQQQIEQGAEVDVFIAAAPKQITALNDAGLLTENSIKNLLGNTLVLVVPADSPSTAASFADVSAESIDQLAVGEPDSVPAGKYAVEVLDSLKIYESVKSKLVYAKDVKEVLTWVESGNADAGVVYNTDALASDKVKVAAVAAEETHSPIIYPAAVIKASANQEAAQAFVDFLSNTEAQAVFQEYGFTII